VLGGGDQIRRRRVDDEHAAVGGSGDVDVVHADAGAADDLEARAGLEQLRRDLGAAAHDEGVVLGQDLGEARSLLGGELVHLGAGLAERGETAGVEGIGDQDLVRHGIRGLLERGFS
jgi:hypothetical protein